jgi:Na+/H+ antiporter NhaD/arsenite permease-like protein
MNPRIVVLLLLLSLLFPPVGIPALLIYLAAKGLDALGRKVEHKRMEQWSAAEPWYTGDDAVDQQILGILVKAKEAGRG